MQASCTHPLGVATHEAQALGAESTAPCTLYPVPCAKSTAPYSDATPNHQDSAATPNCQHFCTTTPSRLDDAATPNCLDDAAVQELAPAVKDS